MGFIDRFSRYCNSRALAWLLVVNVAAAIAAWIATAVFKHNGGDTSILYTWLALPSDALSFSLRPWTIITYSLLHLSVLHLLFNMLWLLWFGRMLADIDRDRSILWIYIGGAIAGGVFYEAASAISGYAPGNFLTGASSAVLALMCATAVRMPSRTLSLFLIGEVKLKWLTLVFVLITVIGSIGTGIPVQAAHIGGILLGLSWYYVKKTVKLPRKPATPRLRPKAVIRAIQDSIPEEERLDQLLDKIRISGYDSLSNKEKRELDYISSRIPDKN